MAAVRFEKRWGWIAMLSLAGIVGIVDRASAALIGLGPAGDYNVYTIGNNTQGGSDVGANGPTSSFGVASGGNFQTSGTTVYGNVVVRGNYSNNGNQIAGNVLAGSANINTPTISGSVTTVGNATFGGGGSVAGGVFYGGTYSGTDYLTRTAVSPASISYPFDFDAAATHLYSLSDTISAKPQTAGSTVTGGAGNQLYLSGSGSSFYVFRVTTSQLANMNDFRLDITSSPAGATVVVDVVDNTGGAVTIHNNGMTLNGIDRQHVLFNFAASMSAINTNGIGFQGTLLAPRSAVTFTGNIDGGLIAGSLSGSGEAHAWKFAGDLTAVPEPGGIAAVLVAGAGGLLSTRRFRRPRSFDTMTR